MHDTKKTYMDAMRDMYITVDCMLLCQNAQDDLREIFNECDDEYQCTRIEVVTN